MLTQKLNEEEARGNIKGLSISNNGPRVSHLLFTDDSFFFCQANHRNAETLSWVLQLYGNLSGQMVNVEKSSITFGSQVSYSKKIAVRQVINITRDGGCSKYLGLPEEFSRKKCEMFNYIVQRVKERTKTCHHKFLSEGGKEVLLKSVALAMPTYAMSCFKLPLSICHEIDSTLSQFWWGSDDSKRRIAWVSWKKMSLPKREGGLGFRDIEKFNDALLAKQAWHIMQNPDCLLARLLKIRYFHDTSLRYATIPKTTSHGWRSIISGRDLLFKGLRTQIGNGSTIDPAVDPWLPTHPPRAATTYTHPLPARLKDLWQSNGKKWDVAKLHTYLNAEDRQYAQRMYIPHHRTEDKTLWHYTKNGSYTMKSGYWLSTHYLVSPIHQLNPPPGNIILKQCIWKTQLSPKIKHFLWRILSLVLGTGSELNRLGIPIDDTCKRCFQHIDTTNHILFQCDYAKPVWKTFAMSSAISSVSNSLEENIGILLNVYDSSCPPEIRHGSFWLLWHLWKSRNDLIFNKLHLDPLIVQTRAKDNALEWLKANPHNPRGTDRRSTQGSFQSQWSPPPPDTYKCNVDASYRLNANTIIVGWIIRDHQGIFKLAASTSLKQGSNALEAEGMALLHALQSLWCRGFRNIILEGDCKSLDDLLHSRSSNMSLDPIITDIRSSADKFTNISFTLVPRQNNQVADTLAKMAYSQDATTSIYFYPPRMLRRLLSNDYVHIT